MQGEQVDKPELVGVHALQQLAEIPEGAAVLLCHWVPPPPAETRRGSPVFSPEIVGAVGRASGKLAGSRSQIVAPSLS